MASVAPATGLVEHVFTRQYARTPHLGGFGAKPIAGKW